MGVLRRFVGALLLCAVVLVTAGFATGHLASVVTNGVSMQPTFAAGDLVVVMRADRYDVGDVVAYRDDERGEVVLHRIVGGDADAYELRGDSNQSIDNVTPAASEVIGRQVLHVPTIGRWIGSPLAMALAAGVLLGIAGVLTVGRSRRTPPAAAVPPAVAVPPAPAAPPAASGDGLGRWRWWHAPLIVADVAVLTGLVAAFAVPPTVVPPPPLPTHTGTLSYGVEVPRSDAYPDGRIVTGDTAFLQIVDHVDVTFRYEGAADMVASARLRIVIDAAGGWTATEPLAPLTAVVAGGVVLQGTIDMVELRQMLARVQETTGVTLTTVQLRVEALVEPDPTSATTLTPYRHQLWFRFDELGLDLAEASVVTPSLDGPVVAFSEPASDSVAAAQEVGGVPFAARRWLFVALLVLVAATVTAWPEGAARRRSRPDGRTALRPDESAPPPPITRVASVDLPHAPLRVRLSSRDDLDAFARDAGSSVLVRDDGWAAVVTDGAVHWWEPDGIPGNPPHWSDRHVVPAVAVAPQLSVPANELPTVEIRLDVFDLESRVESPVELSVESRVDPVMQLQAQVTARRQPLFAPRSVEEPVRQQIAQPVVQHGAAHTVRSTIDEIVAYLAESPRVVGDDPTRDARPQQRSGGLAS